MNDNEAREAHLPNRMIPIPVIEDVDTRPFVHFKNLTPPDVSAISRLTAELQSTGALERAVEDRDVQSLEELRDLVSDAVALAKSEKELNPAVYDEELELSLGGDLDSDADWENPVLDGVDDYGRQMYENSKKAVVSRKSEDNRVKVKLPDGSVVFAEIV